MRTSLIVTTYNRPDALDVVLQSILFQSVVPDEIIVADDGSGPETKNVIDAFRAKCPVVVIHAWQEDSGFRAARVRNLATSKSSGDYLIFIDGDMILHPQFISSHISHAQKGFFLHGKRTLLTQRFTRRVLQKKQHKISPIAPGITMRRYAWHIPLIKRFMNYRSDNWYDTQSANLSLWKHDFVAVNGFNEDFVGWGREDSELAFRLIRHGLRKLELRFVAIAFHLHHGKDNKLKDSRSIERNQDLLNSIVASDIARCSNGLSNHDV